MNKLMSQLNAALNPTAPVMGPPQITVQIAFGMKRRAPSPYGGDFVDSKIFERGRSFRLEARHAKLRILPPVVFNGAVIMALQFVRPDQIAHGWY
jgi:hypothetical protein